MYCLTSEKANYEKKKTHITLENFFTQEILMEWLGAEGSGAIGTAAKNCPPGGIDNKYLHRENTSTCNNTRAVKYLNPIVMVTEEDGVHILHL